jgi:succinoglycan biosynthesis protein ExoO
MAVYNGAAYISRAIESVLAQTEGNLELIVVDDGSTDKTVEIVEGYGRRDTRVRLITGQARGGPGHARNIGIAIAQGEWIALLDSDDWYSEERLEVLLKSAEREGVGLIADNQSFVFGEGFKPHDMLVKNRRHGISKIDLIGLLENDIMGRESNYGLLKPLIRRNIIVLNKIKYINSLRYGEDLIFLLDCIKVTGYLLLLNEPHYFYRKHRNSLCTSPEIDQVRFFLDVQNRYADNLAPGTDPRVERLMRLRSHQIENYIRYRCLSAPLRSGDLKGALQQAASDPAAMAFLIQGGWRFLRRSLKEFWSTRGANPRDDLGDAATSARARKAIGAARCGK